MLMRSRGFSLLETLLALLLSNMLLLTINGLLPKFIRQSLLCYRQFRLEQMLHGAAFKIEKDIRRAGFIAHGKVANAITLSKPSKGAGTCLLIRYDLNLNGVIDGSGEANAELFGYRLHQGAIEQHRGVSDCLGQNWQKITDSNEINIFQFDIEPLRPLGGAPYFKLTLAGHWKDDEHLATHWLSLIKAENL